MLYKTRGIVFSTVKYTDNSFIAKIYTELFGLQSFLVNNPRGKKSVTKVNVFQPLNPVELVMYHKEKKQLQRIREIKTELPLKTIPFDNNKSSIVFFLNEILCKCIKEEESRPGFFQFIRASVLRLDEEGGSIAGFHLHFLIELAGHLGFRPHGNFSAANPFFNLQEGNFQSDFSENCLAKETSETLFALLQRRNEKISSSLRMELLSGLLLYYKLHMQGFGEVKSRKVLQEILS